MSHGPSLERTRRFSAVLLVTGFLAVICLPLLDSGFKLDRTPQPNENRELAKFPKFRVASNGVDDFLAGLTAYYSDHFGFRKRLIVSYNQWKQKLFHESPVSAVMTGQEGWLYYTGDRMIEEYIGATLFTDAQLQEWQRVLEVRRDALARRGIHYLFVIAPNKQTIYPEHLPNWLKRSGSTTKLDQFVAHMRAHSTVPVLNLRDPMLYAKSWQRLYPRTDTHWNDCGAFIATQQIIEKLAEKFPDLKPHSPDAYKLTVRSGIGCDLAVMLGQENTIQDDHYLLEPLPPLQPLQKISSPELLEGRWAPDTVPIVTENPNGTHSLVMFRDSFGIPLMPFLGQHFQRVEYFTKGYLKSCVLERVPPEIVIDEMVERHLVTMNPARMLRKE